MVSGHLQQKSGYYYCVLSYTYDGKPRTKWISTGLKVKGNKKRAEEMLIKARILFNVDDPDNVPDIKAGAGNGKMRNILKMDINKSGDAGTAGNYTDNYYLTDLCDEWLKHCHPPRVAESTYAMYKTIVKKHIMPYFTENKCLVKDIDSRYAQRYFNYAYEKKLSNKTVSNHRGILSSMFSYAISINELDSNPLTKIEPPPKSQPLENYFSAKELIQLLKIVKDTDFRYPVYMAVIYGLRRSEVCGLKWSAVDFENQQFTIRHTLHELPDDNDHMKVFGKDQTKNKKIKVFPFLDEIELMLTEMKKHQEELGIYDSSGYVYIKDDGKPVRPRHVSEHFTILLKNNNLRHIRFHDLRHSCASVLLTDHNRSVSLKDIQVWLGHNDIGSTMRYAHIADIKTKEHTAKLMEEIIFSKEK